MKKRELTNDEKIMIYNKRVCGDSLMKIAKEHSISPEGVRKIIRRINETGSPENMRRNGRPRKTTDRDDRKIMQEISLNPRITAHELKEKLELNIGITSIKNRIHEHGIRGYVARKKPMITPKNQSGRYNWAIQYENNPPEFWESVIWSDESKFLLINNNRRQYVWRKPGEAFKIGYTRPTVKHGGGSIMVWGCFSSSGVGNIVFIEGKMNGEIYKTIINQNLKQSAEKMGLGDNFVFQQDNDPKHTSKTVQKFLAQEKISVLPWPPQSPDLNPIENLWQYLDDHIPKSSRTNINSFKLAIADTWEKIPVDYLKKLVNSMNNRLNAVLQSKGGPTKY